MIIGTPHTPQMCNSLLASTNREAEFLDEIGKKSLKSFPPCYSQFPLLIDFTPQAKVGCYVNIVYENLKSENSQD
jgi:hypothetical protein